MTDTASVQLICPDCGAVNRVAVQKLGDRPVCGKCRGHLIGGQPVIATDRTFARFIDKTGLPMVVDFWAPWCGPCQQFAPVFSQTAAEMATRVVFLKLDTQTNPHTAAHYQIRSIPTLMLFYQGREVTRLSGALPKAQFQQWLHRQLSGLGW